MKELILDSWKRLTALRKNWRFHSQPPIPPGTGPVDVATDIFSSPVELIGDEEPSRFVVRAGAVAALMFSTLILVSALVEIDVVVSGTGELVLDGAPETIQPIERSVIKSMRVKPGSLVKKGDVVVTLDPTFTQADLKALSQRKEYLTSLVNRLSAEASGIEFKAQSGHDYDELQESIFKERQGAFNAKLRSFDEEIASLGKSAGSQKTHQQYLKEQLAIASEVEAMRQGLYETKIGSRLMLLEAQNLRLRTQKEAEESVSRANELHHAKAARLAERQNFMDDWRRSLLEELARSKEELSRINEEVDKSQRRLALIELKAGTDGVISEVAAVSEGSVVREAEALVTIMPTDRKLIAEVYVKATDAGHAKVGDPAVIKVDAYPYQRFGTLPGRLSWISEATYSPQVGAERSGLQAPNRARLGGAALHRARIEFDSSAQAPELMKIMPGMTVTADVKLKTRSVLGLLFEPLQRGLQESLKEP